jgi:pimeloyl-ACP methyl ester carboxylesterase
MFDRNQKMPVLSGLVLSMALAAGPAWSQPTLKLESCHLPRVSTPVKCGTLSVPENRDTGQGRMIDLNLAVIPALEQPPRPDPLFILAGGPGQSAVGIAMVIKTSLGKVNRYRDIVLMDQRGTGQSNPLNCDFDLDDLAFNDESKARAVNDCLSQLDADPRHYTTINHIEDLEAVRQALGYDQINLYGGSYGTRVAQVYLREHPESLRAVVMDAVASMDMKVGMEMGADAQLTLDALFDRCAKDPACQAEFPELGQTFSDLMSDLEANPRDVSLPNPATGIVESTPMDHRTFALALRGILYAPTTQRLVPLVISEASRDNWAPILGLSLAAGESLQEVMTPGLLFAVLCAEDLSDVTSADIPQRERDSFVGTSQIDEFLGFCAAWPKPLSRVDWSPPTAGNPVLLLSGALDPATPPYRADDAARSLGNSRHIVVPNGGHTVGSVACIADLIGEFLESADPAGLDAECVAEIASPSFFVSTLGPKP